MNPAPIDPWAFELPEYLQRVSVSPGATRQYDAALHPDDFYQDDRQITAAALELHPLLGETTVAALLDALTPVNPDLHLEPGTVFPELGEGNDAAIHLLVAGRARLVATFRSGGEERRRVLAQYRPGQWIGLPNLLREADRRVGWPSGRFEAQALSNVRTQRIALDVALALMKSHPDFRRFVEHHVAIRFARRSEIMRCVGKNPLLRLLNPADREYLLQLGAIVSPGSEVGSYLAAGRPSTRAALLLRGEATLRVPGSTTGRNEYVATLRPGDLFGHEGLVMDAELRNPSQEDVKVVEPPRRTEVRLTPDAQVLQLDWYALRWVLDDRAAVWSRVKRMLSDDPAGIADPMPTIVSFHAARPGLGATALAYGTARARALGGTHRQGDRSGGTEEFRRALGRVWLHDHDGAGVRPGGPAQTARARASTRAHLPRSGATREGRLATGVEGRVAGGHRCGPGGGSHRRLGGGAGCEPHRRGRKRARCPRSRESGARATPWSLR